MSKYKMLRLAPEDLRTRQLFLYPARVAPRGEVQVPQGTGCQGRGSVVIPAHPSVRAHCQGHPEGWGAGFRKQ